MENPVSIARRRELSLNTKPFLPIAIRPPDKSSGTNSGDFPENPFIASLAPKIERAAAHGTIRSGERLVILKRVDRERSKVFGDRYPF